MSDDVTRALARLLDTAHVTILERVQSLWSGYGEIVRVETADGRRVIVKSVRPPGGRSGSGGRHPRGWATNRSHERKLRSYDVELAFYQSVAPECDADCRVPTLLAGERSDDGWLFVLEDLDAAGFPERRHALDDAGLTAALDWLAAFHARCLNRPPSGLWPTGTYWHLATRPDELAATRDADLAAAASALDTALESARWKTLVHGDAKVANFCFGPGGQIAAVDFQYVGGGCGMKDVAYFFSSCLSETECERRADGLLDHYFVALRAALTRRDAPLLTAEMDQLETEWRRLYPVAWADFARFLSGWAPEHWKLHRYTREMTRRALATL